MESKNKTYPIASFIYKLKNFHESKDPNHEVYAIITEVLSNKINSQLPSGYYCANIMVGETGYQWANFQRSELSRNHAIIIAIENHCIFIDRIVDQKKWILSQLQVISIEGQYRYTGMCSVNKVFSHSLQDYLNAIDKINLNGSSIVGESIEGSPILEAEMVKE